MSKYKLTVKYSGVCELSFESSKKETVEKEFDRYLASFLSGKILRNALKINYAEAFKKMNEEKPEETAPEEQEAAKVGTEAQETTADKKEINFETDKQEESKPKTKKEKENKPENEEQKAAEAVEKSDEKLSFKEYIKDKKILSQLDEFVAGACYLDEVLNIKDFTLKQINSKLYPTFRHLADLGVIEYAKKRVLIESKEIKGQTHYSINENAWNYHNYDLVGH